MAKFAWLLLLLGVVLVQAGTTDNVVYRVELHGRLPSAVSTTALPQVTVLFKIRRLSDQQLVRDVHPAEIVVTRNGRHVRGVDVRPPPYDGPAAAVLALDASAPAVGTAALFEHLGAGVALGWVLYDRRVQCRRPPSAETTNWQERLKLFRNDGQAHPLHRGTGYLDAASEAIAILEGAVQPKAIVLQTSGADWHSRHSPQQVIEAASKAGVAIHAIGIGVPGQREPLTAVLVLDSRLAAEANAADWTEPVRTAAAAVIDTVPADAALSVLSAQGRAGPSQSLVADRPSLKQTVEQFRPALEKSPFDSAYVAVAMLDAARRPGKYAVVFLTDGIDLHSRHRVEEVIAEAKSAGIAIHVVGIGPAAEQAVLRRMVRETGGSYHAVATPERLTHVCEDLALHLCEQTIDEPVLRTLAERTGGRYFAVRDPTMFADISRQVADELRAVYSMTIPLHERADIADLHGIDIYVVRDGVKLSGPTSESRLASRAFNPELEPYRFLVLLVMLAGLLGLRSRRRAATA